MTKSTSASKRRVGVFQSLLRGARPREIVRDILMGSFSAALLVLAGVVLVIGLPYYITPVADRSELPLHDWFYPGRPVGVMLGIVGTSLLVALLAYSARKWVPWLAFMGSSRTWMTFHFVCGMAAPLFVVLHSAVQWPSWGSITAIGFWCMVLVALSGVFGRYLFGYFPQGAANVQHDLSRLQSEFSEVRTELVAHTSGRTASHVARALSLATDLDIEPKTLGELVVLDAESRHRTDVIRILLYRARLPATLRERAERSLVEQLELRRRRAGFDVARRLLRYWNLLHQPLALAMYLSITVHILNAAIFAGSFNYFLFGEP